MIEIREERGRSGVESCHVNNHEADSRKSPCPSGGRARDLVESLLASLDQPDARIDELWAKEAENRLAAFEAGQTKAYPADKVFQEFADL